MTKKRHAISHNALLPGLVRTVAGAVAFLTGAIAFGGWELSGSATVEPNAPAMVRVVQTRQQDAKTTAAETSRTLWLTASKSPEALVASTAQANLRQAYIPVFIRGEGNAWITILDSADNSSSTIYLDVRRPALSNQQQAWLPRLKIQGEDNLPVLLANQPTTAILELSQGFGSMPPTTHISAIDHRGRLVMSQFYNTFDLAAGTSHITMPAAGEYTMTVRLLKENRDRFPRARYRTPFPIPFGETRSQFEPPAPLAGITTQTIVGTRVALEELPTTATVVSTDRLRVISLGRHSREMQRNRWPYVIAGANLIDMPRDQRYTKGVQLLQWQRRLGSSFGPVKVLWSDLQKDPGAYRWADLADTLPIYRKLMVRPLVTLTGRAAWNNQTPMETTATAAAWKACVQAIADRYTDVMWGFYCWNHPDKIWKSGAAYQPLLMLTADGLQNSHGKKRAGSPLITGPLTDYLPEYLDQILIPDTLAKISGVAIDLLPTNPGGSPESNGYLTKLGRLAGMLRAKGHEKLQLWINATGWPSGPGGVSEELQANYLVRTHIMALASGAEKITWCHLTDQANTQKNPELHWQPTGQTGLLDADMMPRLSGVAYALMTYVASGVSSPTVTTQGNAHITSFNLPLQNNKWAGTLYVAWTDSPQKLQTVRLDMKHGGGVYAFDYLGAEIPTTKVAGDAADPITGTYTLPVGFEPVYIWDAGKPNRGGA